MTLLQKLALLGAVLAAVYQIAPGEPAWMTELHPPPSPGPYESLQFVGGDGVSKLSGRLHRPPQAENERDDAATLPVIVMVNGLGLTQDSNVTPYRHAFINAGFAVITFDFATFGYSDGWPRHQVKPQHHVADLKAVLRQLQTKSDQWTLDNNRVALWGTSMGGGHVLTVAADVAADELPIKAIVGNVPHVKSALESVVGTIRRDPLTGLTGLLQVTGALIKWAISQLMKGETTYIPLHGPPGSAAMMQNPADDEGYSRLILEETRDSGWTNLASVGSVVPTLFYRPYNNVGNIEIPTLLIVAENDTLCPASAARDAAKEITKARLVTLPGIGHFDVYNGEALHAILKETVAFLKEHV